MQSYREKQLRTVAQHTGKILDTAQGERNEDVSIILPEQAATEQRHIRC